MKYYASREGVQDSSFLRVCNHGSQSPLLQSINWDGIIEAALEHGKLDQHQGHYHVDMGRLIAATFTYLQPAGFYESCHGAGF